MNKYLPEGSLLREARNFEYTRSFEGLSEAMRDGIILEGIAVLCDHNLNLHIDLGQGILAVIPRNEAALTDGEEIKDIAILTRVGKPVCFKVIGFEEKTHGRRVAVLSRRSAQLECRLNYIESLAPGDIIPARVTHLESFGAFVDIGCGITSLLSIDTISVSRISHPSARLSVGDTIYTAVKSIDARGRIFVTLRELLGSWEENAARFNEGETVRGIIRSVESYGVFVELTPNLAGLAEYRKDVSVGQSAAVYIKSILPDKMKIKLIIIDAQDTAPEPTPIEYFVSLEKARRLGHWLYSPPSSKRVIETVFD